MQRKPGGERRTSMKTSIVVCGAALVCGCASVPPVQKVESNQACDYESMARIEAQWQPTLIEHYWVNCPQVRPK
jgi:hypothetical protein